LPGKLRRAAGWNISQVHDPDPPASMDLTRPVGAGQNGTPKGGIFPMKKAEKALKIPVTELGN